MVVYWSCVPDQFVIRYLFGAQLLIDIRFAVMHREERNEAEPFVAYFPAKGSPTLLYQLYPGGSAFLLLEGTSPKAPVVRFRIAV
jgi:hypothetical protein